MSDHHESERALTEGLRNLSAPEPSADFNSRVLEALQRPEPWWQFILPRLRPLVSGAVCAIILTIVLTKAALNSPDSSPTVSPARAEHAVLAEDALDQPDLKAGSFARLATDREPARIPTPSAPESASRHPRGQSRRLLANHKIA